MPKISPEQEKFRVVPLVPGSNRIVTIKRDPVEPVPVGTYIAVVFRVTGYRPDCDGSLMADLENVNRHGEATGWETNCIGLYPDTEVVLDGPGELHRLAGVPEGGEG